MSNSISLKPISEQSVAIIGGGPAGAALATLCARDGMRVDIYEGSPEAAPGVGESLLPYGHRMWDKLGLDLSDAMVKKGAVFYRRGQAERIRFEEAENCPYHSAYQVDRRILDPRCRELAVQAGANFIYEHLRSQPQGYDWVVDASGRRRTLGRNWTTYDKHPLLCNIAKGSHFQGAQLPEGCEPGDIAIVGEDHMWFWGIPLAPGLISLGVVLTGPVAHLSLEEAIARSPVASKIVQGATMLSKPRGYADFTEKARAISGDGWALVGDAAMFIDPVFSSGVLFALESADLVHQLIRREISAGDYQRRLFAASEMMETTVLGFYNGDFLDLVFSPRECQTQEIRSGLIGLLAGNLFGHAGKPEKMVARRLEGLAILTRKRMAPVEPMNAPILLPAMPQAAAPYAPSSHDGI